MLKNILAVGAHPDDIEFSCFGILAKSIEFGSQVTTYVASSGSSGDSTSGPLRVQESSRAIASLGKVSVNFEENTGVGYADYERISDKIRELLIQNRIDTILVHSPHDTHQEHRLVYDITRSAARRIKINLLQYKSVSSTVDFAPNYFLEISDKIDLKKEALKFHKSQSNQLYMDESSIELFNSGIHSNVVKLEHYEFFHIESLFG